MKSVTTETVPGAIEMVFDVSEMKSEAAEIILIPLEKADDASEAEPAG